MEPDAGNLICDSGGVIKLETVKHVTPPPGSEPALLLDTARLKGRPLISGGLLPINRSRSDYWGQFNRSKSEKFMLMLLHMDLGLPDYYRRN